MEPEWSPRKPGAKKLGAMSHNFKNLTFPQAEPDGTGTEPEEALGKTPKSSNGTGRNRGRNRPDSEEALDEIAGQAPPAFF